MKANMPTTTLSLTAGLGQETCKTHEDQCIEATDLALHALRWAK